ncbi:hemerythrin domain-containing protein [Nocardia sp. CA-151230]|uniref:hemerythrin domain-containing protein n=1 Tax=Nocardia sp. CA-151230 TaxID=3239982 RepID=UPI003D908A24
MRDQQIPDRIGSRVGDSAGPARVVDLRRFESFFRATDCGGTTRVGEGCGLREDRPQYEIPELEGGIVMPDPNNPGQFGNRSDTEQQASKGGKASSGSFGEANAADPHEAGRKGGQARSAAESEERDTSTEQDDVIALLQQQHTQIKTLLQQVEGASGEAKRQPFENLVRLLAVHESAEEQVVHPASRRAKVAGEVVDDRLHEEEEAKHVLAELYELGVTDDRFAGKFQDFAASVIEHAEMEEKEEFDQLRRSLSGQDSARLATAVRVAEAVAPTRPHPQAGESATANLVFGPPLALFDRIRDAVRDWRTQSEG